MNAHEYLQEIEALSLPARFAASRLDYLQSQYGKYYQNPECVVGIYADGKRWIRLEWKSGFSIEFSKGLAMYHGPAPGIIENRREHYEEQAQSNDPPGWFTALLGYALIEQAISPDPE